MRTTEARPIEPADATTAWRTFAHALARPYPVTAPMIALLAIIPIYIFLPELTAGRTQHVPEIALDRGLPLLPGWALVYGPLYLFLILLPVFTIRREAHIRATFLAYLMVWLAAYVVFVVYPTRAPRPAQVIGEGFAAWGLRFLYSADPPYNCFPSLHVAHSFVSALTCYRMHRRVGVAALISASIIGLSTLFTKQHYVFDVVAGVMLAGLACAVFLRHWPREETSSEDARVAPAVALWTGVIVGLAFACSWLAFEAARLQRHAFR